MAEGCVRTLARSETNGAPEFGDLKSVVLTKDGRLIATDSAKHCLWQIDVKTGKCSLHAGRVGIPGYEDGLPDEATFTKPSGICEGRNDYSSLLFVTDEKRFVQITRDGRAETIEISDESGGGVEFIHSTDDGQFFFTSAAKPDKIFTAFDQSCFIRSSPCAQLRQMTCDWRGTLHVIDSANQRVGLVTTEDDGAVTTIWAAETLGLCRPTGLAIGIDGYFYIADTGNHCISTVEIKTGRPTGRPMTLCGLPKAKGCVDAKGSAARLDHPYSLALDPFRNVLYFTEPKAIREVSLIYHQPSFDTCAIESSLRTDLQALLESSAPLGTFKFIVGDEAFSAPKCILAARCNYFKSMIESGLKEAIENEVVVKDTTCDALKAVLAYVVTDRYDIDSSEPIEPVYALAHRYGVEKLVSLCRAHMVQSLSFANVFERVEFGQAYNDDQIVRSCAELIARNLKAVLELEGFSELSKDVYLQILKVSSSM